jgi:hypothetical protein
MRLVFLMSLSYFFTANAAVAATATKAPSANKSQQMADTAIDLRAGRPAIMARINGGEAIPVNYDTGSLSPIISKRLADLLKLPIVGEMLVGSPGGSAPIAVNVVSLGSLSVGGYNARTAERSLDAAVMEDARLPPGVDIIIGNNQFPGALIEFDFARERLRISDSVTREKAGWQALDERGLLAGILQIGSVKIPLYVDAGNPGWLDLPKSFSAQLPLQGALRETATPIKMVDRTIPRFAASMETDATVAGIAVTLKGEFTFADFPFANLGVKALKQTGARLLIDNRSKRWKLVFAGSGKPLIGA